MLTGRPDKYINNVLKGGKCWEPSRECLALAPATHTENQKHDVAETLGWGLLRAEGLGEVRDISGKENKVSRVRAKRQFGRQNMWQRCAECQD